MSIITEKEGMMSLATDQGVVAVTVLRVCPMKVSKIEGDAVEIAYKTQDKPGKAQSNKALEGHLKRAGIAEKGSKLKSFKASSYASLLEEGASFELGQEINALGLLEAGSLVDASANTKGKGFQGAVARWNFSMQRATHGNSLSHRALGSTGQCQDPGRVFKGKKMAGRDGNQLRTTCNLEVKEVGEDYILVKGAVPGPKGGLVILQKAVKARGTQKK